MAETYVDHRTYAPQGQSWDDAKRQQYFNSLQSGSAVDGSPGRTWQHKQGAQGLGWYQTDNASSPEQPGATSSTPSTTAPSGIPAGGTALPPSPPAPQIPLGSTTQPGQMPPAASGAPGQPVSSTPLVDASATNPTNDAYRQALLRMLSINPNDVSLTDADIAPQQRAAEAAIQRQALQDRAGLMERASAQGVGDSAATEAAGQAIGQQAARDIGGKNADLLGQKMQQRREQLQVAMQQALQLGMQQEANDLQRQIANLDAQFKQQGMNVSREQLQLQRDLGNLDAQSKQSLAQLDAQLRREGYGLQERLAQMDAELRRLGINTQGNLGTLELALRRELGIGELNLGLLQAMLQNQQFNNNLGFDIGQWQSILNRDAVLAGLGGR